MGDKDVINQKAKAFVAQMTVSEKASLCSGKDCWHTKAIERLGLESIMMSDGPNGLRKQIGDTDNLGVGESVPAVCFPTASAIACSFDRNLIYEVGKAMGEACVLEEISILLGPGTNQKRSPLCGRNFEYLSEDPLVSGELATSMIKGVQSTGTGSSLKHFAVNNQEKRRMTINAVIDERTLRETYLRAFEIAVKKGNPSTVMCSYNKINGEYSSENEYLLTDILRKEWGFTGAVVSDWGAVHDRALGVMAGLDLEMPGNDGYNDEKVRKAMENKSISSEALDTVACRVTELVLRAMEEKQKKKEVSYDKEAQHQLAVRAEEQSAVLLKNKDNILPGTLEQKAAVIGAFANKVRYQGAGSSKINPVRVENPWDIFLEYGLDVTYAPGYSLDNNEKDKEIDNQKLHIEDKLIKEACEIAKEKDIVYVFAGLPEGYESEGFDREDMCLPERQNRLIEAVCACNSNVVVILIGGAPMELPWINKVNAVLLAYLGGEGVGRAVVNLLLGSCVPSGKLAETWPISVKDTPCYHYFPGKRLTVEYRESIYVGYRYYEKANKPVLFPFGHGLSYTSFLYANLKVEKDTCNFGDRLKLSFDITNCGNLAAKETVFIFVSHENEWVYLPKKELREFVKVELEAGETKAVMVMLDTGTFGYYNTLIKDWYCESGTYQILVGSSLDKIFLKEEIYINAPKRQQPDYKNMVPTYYQLPEQELIIPVREFEALYGRTLPISKERVSKPFNSNNTLEDVSHTLMGKLIIRYAKKLTKEVTKSEREQEGMIGSMIYEMPFFAMVASGEGMISERMMEGMIDLLNGHYIKGVAKLVK